MEPVHRVIETKADVEAMRRAGQAGVRDLGGLEDVAAQIALLITELGTNILRYATEGHMTLYATAEGRACMHISASDEGPGIADIERALTPGFSSSHGLGEGLPLVRRLSDTFQITSNPRGTTVEVTKWITPPPAFG